MESKGLVKEGALLLFVSLVFNSFGLLSFLYIVPLLLFAIHGGKRRAELLLLLCSFLILLLEIFHQRDMEMSKLNAALLFVSLYFPWSLSAAGIVWLETEHDHRLIRRLYCTLAPALVLLLFLALFIATDRALLAELHEGFQNALAVSLGEMLASFLPGVEMSVIAEIVLLTLMSMLMPLLLVCICACCFIYTSIRHSRESDWEQTVMAFEYPPNAVWGFIVSWALVLLLHFVPAADALVAVIVNIALAEGVLYAIEGFSVVFARLRRRNGRVKSMSVFIVLAVMAIALPGINFIVILGLPLLGVLESFFDLKKIGALYEDHS